MRPLFPKWTNLLPTALAAGGGGFVILVIAGFWYYATPKFWNVGYQPKQPVAFSHQIHAGQLGMDCRYCHTHVDKGPFANVPSASTCMNCHTVANEMNGYLKKALSVDGSSPSAHWVSADLQRVREAYNTGLPVPWRRIHKVPDYVQFPHQAHLNAGVSCYSCHRRIDEMPTVYQAEPLSMGWCLDCHRAPEKQLVGKEYVTDLAAAQKMIADPQHAATTGARLVDQLQKRPPYAPPQHCGACHY